ncbi:MAG TPA: hypothetical protein PKZ32_01200, partial [Candidatus Melainabacteria bacterium]|nr:hypothetical protein [Candidatus Melainabacteria bacterium]
MNGGQSRSTKTTVAAVLQAVLFGCWPVLVLYALTLGEYTSDQLVEPLVLSALTNLILWSLLRLLKVDPARAACVVTLLTLANFFYLPLSALLSLPARLIPVPPSEPAILLGYILLLVVFVLLALTAELRFGKSSLLLNFEPAVMPALIVTCALCGFNIFTIVNYENKTSADAIDFGAKYFPFEMKVDPSKSIVKPDVYYVVIDGFASSATLKDLLGYDNSGFIDYLKQKGFYVAQESMSNHDRTVLSVTSSLNMGLMTPLAEVAGKSNPSSNVPIKLLRDNRVMKFFKRAGYRIVNVCSGFCLTDFIPQADVNLRSGWGTGFSMSLLHLSLLGALEPFLHAVENEYANVRTAPVRRAAEIAEIQGPKFVLIHCLLTHPPFIFDEIGRARPLTKELLSAPYVKDSYLAQLKFTEKNLKKLLNVLCHSQSGEPIVILQSDHGSACTDWHDKRNFTLERMRILNAYKVPARIKESLYSSITPVNTFPLLLNELFAAGIP